jgi:hypothetical protein
MKWFKKTSEHKELWEQEIQWPIGDIEAAHRIRDICRSAADSAQKLAGTGQRPAADGNYDKERYERAAKAAMQIAIKMSDELLRDASLKQIVNLCMSANDLTTARTLFRAIGAASIRQDVLSEHPGLRR